MGERRERARHVEMEGGGREGDNINRHRILYDNILFGNIYKFIYLRLFFGCTPHCAL